MSESEFLKGRGGDAEPGAAEAAQAARGPWRLPVEMPRPGSSRESKVLGRVVSFAIHALIVLAMLAPALLSSKVRAAIAGGAGGAGPAGGGGGRGGVVGPREKLRYVRVAPEPAATQAPVVTPPVVTPPKPPPVEPTPQPQAVPTTQPQDAAATGAASGSGDASGAGGAGPGSGGGTGAGVGTGTGSANGPGTGGGADTLNPPFSLTMLMPPQPVPKKLRQRTIRVEFDIDSTGRVLAVNFDETPDGDYNKKIREAAKQFRFRPATRRDGRPVRAVYPVEWLL